MVKIRILALTTLSLTSVTSAQDVPVIHVPSPAFATSPAPMPTYTPTLMDLVPGAVECENGAVTPVAIERPFPIYLSSFSKNPLPPIALTFAIDANGRPISIAREPNREALNARLYFSDEDLQPSFAASRFPGGKPQAKCRITYDLSAAPFPEAPLPLVQRYFVAPHTRQPAERELFKRLHPANTNCIESGTPKLRLRAYPAFEEIPQAPGTSSFAMTAFDIDAKGKPVKVRIVGSDGNARLNRESIIAVQNSRFAPEARTGCTYPYRRRQREPLAAPSQPDKASFIAADAKCSEKDSVWATKPQLHFPSGFNRRSIEGWAVVGYDIAPWGQPGNVRVLASQPSAVFGMQAMGIIANARQTPSATGRTGCVYVVRFVMASTTPATATTDTD